jgi:hypothetical protein
MNDGPQGAGLSNFPKQTIVLTEEYISEYLRKQFGLANGLGCFMRPVQLVVRQ